MAGPTGFITGTPTAGGAFSVVVKVTDGTVSPTKTFPLTVSITALTITSADKLMNDLPANTVALKRDALKVALQAFSYYPYQTGQFVVDYAPGSGGAKLKLDGPMGKRDFEVYWHPFGSSEVAKDADSH